jgi:hypothetical protein
MYPAPSRPSVYLTPSPNANRQRIVGNLYLLIGSWLEGHPIRPR